jgi:cytochrome c oxidase subunit 2
MASVQEGTFWLPPAKSTVAGDVDGLYDFILWINVFFFVAITGATIYFAWKYRRRSHDQLAKSQVGHNTMLEATWTFVPLVLCLILFVWGFRVFLDLTVAPEGSYQVQVTAEKWKWTFTHPDGTVRVNELHAPAGQPVKLVMSSRDVLHSFFVPEFRIKQDVVPNRYSTVWFDAPAPGDSEIYCTEYCGTGHSGMLAMVHVLSKEDWDKGDWRKVELPEGKTMVEWGGDLYKKYTCNTCHSVDGSRLVGPSFKGLFGREEKIQGGPSVVVDENYFRESIFDPQAKIVEGFAPAMPTFKGQIQDVEIDALMAFVKSLK